MKRHRPTEECENSPKRKDQNDPDQQKIMVHQCSQSNVNNENIKRNDSNGKQENVECEWSILNEDSEDTKQNFSNNTSLKQKSKSKAAILRAFKERGLEAIKTFVEDGEDKNFLLLYVVNSKVTKEIKTTVEYLLNKGASADFAIKYAISYGDIELIQIFLDFNADVNNALQIAVRKVLSGNNTEVGDNDKNIICLLLARGADVKVHCEAEKMSMLQLMFNKGANRLIEIFLGTQEAKEINEEQFKCLQTLPDTLRGYIYQIMLTTVIALRAAFKDYKIGSEVANALGFDDIVLMPVQQAETNNCQFVQIKQTKKTDITKIKEADLMSMLESKDGLKKNLKGDFSFVKNFMNFNETLLKSSYENVNSADFFICTNMNFIKDSSPYYKSSEIANDFFNGLGKPYRLHNVKLFMLEVKFVLLNMIDANAIMHIKIVEEKEKLEQQIEHVDNIVHKIKRGEINMDTPYEEAILWPIDRIITVGLEHLKVYLKYITNCTVNISKANNMAEIKQNIPKECKCLDFTKNLNDTKKDCYSALKDVTHRLTGNEDFFEKFNGWTEVKLHSRIDKFMKNFTLLINCPSTSKLNEMITEELSDRFKLSNLQFLTDHIVRNVENWISSFVNEQAEYLRSNHFQKAFDHLSSLVSSLKATGVTENYIETIKRNILYFENDHPQLLHFLNTTNASLLHIITDHTLLNIMKVVQTVSNFKCDKSNFKNIDSFLFINIERLKYHKISTSFLTAFSSVLSHHLLVIEIPDEFKEFESLSNVLEDICNILRQNVNKKIIIIASRDCILVSKLKSFQIRCDSYHEPIKFKDLVANSRDFVLEKNLSFPTSIALTPGKATKLNDFFDLQTAFEKIDEEILSVIIETPINIIDHSKQVPNEFNECNSNYFISRTIHKQFIKTEILESFQNNLFFVTGMSEENLYDTLKDRNMEVYIWEEGKSFEQGIILLSKQDIRNINEANEEIFEIICDTCGKKYSDNAITNNIFWFEYQQEHLIWKGCKFASSYPYEFIDKYSAVFYPNNESQIKEDLFFLPENVDEKVIILANDSGGGKSTILTYLAHFLRKEYPFLWIVRVNLRNYTNNRVPAYLNSIDFNENDTLRAIETLTRMIFQSFAIDSNMALQKQLFLSILSGEAKTEVIVLFDGFDEICPEYKDKTCTLLKALKKCRIRQLWITTTVEWKPLLEQQLQIPAFMLTTFSESEQIGLINRFWKWRLKFIHDNETKTEDIVKYLDKCLESDTKRNECFDKCLKNSFQNLKDAFTRNANGTIEELRQVIDSDLDFSKYAELLIREWSASICDVDYTFSTVPLHVTMLSENIFKTFMNISTLKSLGLFEIYKQFVDNKLKIYQQKGSTQNGNQIDQDQAEFAASHIRNRHHELAAQHRFGNVRVIQEETLRDDQNAIKKLRKIGFIRDNGTVPEFTHHSFADFFCCEYLITHFKRIMVQSQLLERILVDSNHHLMQKFLNGFLSLNKKTLNLNTWKKIIKLRNDRDESALQIAAIAGNMEICMLLLNSANKTKNLSKNFILNYDYRQQTALYSIVAAEDNIKVFVLYFNIVKKYPGELRNLMMTPNTNGRTVFEKATEKGKMDICKKILKHFEKSYDLNDLLSHRDSDGRSILFYAIKSSRLLCELIIKYAIRNRDLLNNLITHCVFKDRMSSQRNQNELSRSQVNHCKLSALHIAAYFSKPDVCALILETATRYFRFYPVILMRDHLNQTILHIAARKNSETCHWIFEVAEPYRGIPARLITYQDTFGQVPLHKAVQGDKREICELILQKAEQHDKLAYVLKKYDYDQMSPLDLAIKNGYKEMYLLILEYARRFNSTNVIQELFQERDRFGRTILHLAASVSVDIFLSVFNTANNIEGLLMELTIRPDKYGRTILHTAVEAGKIEICELILSKIGPGQFHSSDSKGNSILHSAVLTGSAEMCAYVLNTSEEYSETMMMMSNNSGDTVLHLAITKSIEICKLILHNAENLETWRYVSRFLLTHHNNGCRQTALHISVSEGNTQACYLIFKYALKSQDIFREMVEKIDANSYTFLHLAFVKCPKIFGRVFFDIFQRVPHLFHNILTLGDESNSTAFHLSVWHDRRDLFILFSETLRLQESMLREALLSKDNSNQNILHVAVSKGDREFCRLILDIAQACPFTIEKLIHEPNWLGISPLNLSRRHNRGDITEMLLPFT